MMVARYFVNQAGLGKKSYFQYLELAPNQSGKIELLRISGKVGGSKRKIRKKYPTQGSAQKDFEELLRHLIACGYEEKTSSVSQEMRQSLLS